jgi:hypothetical protein
MTTVASRRPAGKAGFRKPSFRQVAAMFLDESDLPFADVLSSADIEQIFARRDALFADDSIFSTPVVLWGFLGQALRDGKGAACASAVAEITTYMQQTGQSIPCGDTGVYCRARRKLDDEALRDTVIHVASGLRAAAPLKWLWYGRHAKLVDGFTFTMPDTYENQKAFPQSSSQDPGVGFPIARACVVLSLATAAVHDLAIGRYEGKETGETALLRTMLDGFVPGDIVVFDRCYGSFLMLALLQQRGVDVCTRLHQCRDGTLSRIAQLGPNDWLVRWTRPERPDWMDEELYAQIPQTLTLRQIELMIKQPGSRVERMTVVTTLTSSSAYSGDDIGELYGYRWNAELDILQVKQTLGVDHMRCKSPQMVRVELWVKLLAYNLIRKVIATAALAHGKQPRQLGFTRTCQSILSSWMLTATGAIHDAQTWWTVMLEQIANNEVANRPGRIEPRVLKRRRHRYPLMTRPRDDLRRELEKP